MIVVVTTAAITVEMVKMIATLIVKATIVKTMISNKNGNDWGEPPSDREDEDEGRYYEDYDDDIDYYDGDIEDDAEDEPIDMRSDIGSDQYRLVNLPEVAGEEVEEANNIDYDDHPYRRLLDWSCVTDVSSKSGP